MNLRIHIPATVFAVVLMSWSGVFAGINPSTDRIFEQLDSVIANHENPLKENDATSSMLRLRLGQAGTADDRYAISNLLYDQYKTYSMDSALKYAENSRRIALEANNLQRVAESRINKSFVLTAGGLLKEAMEAVDGIDASQLDHDMRVKYYGQMVYLYSHLGNYSSDGASDGLSDSYYKSERAYKDSVLRLLRPGDPEYKWFAGWEILGSNRQEDKVRLAQELKSSLSEARYETRQDAMNSYMLSRLLSETGDEEGALRYMAASAIADIQSNNRDVASLEEIAKTMFERGDVVRAYNYLNESIQASILYPNRVRMAGMLKSLDKISHAYQERLDKEQRNTRAFLILAVILSIALLVVLVVLVRSMSKLRTNQKALRKANRTLNGKIEELSEAQRLIEETNSELNSLNEQLKSSNSQLTESNYVKEEYLGYVFALCSNYIKKHEDFRKSIKVKLKARNYQEIDKMTETSGIAREHLKEFYHNFDTIFLNIYPTFIDDFNSLLQPGEEIYPRNGELLNTELRIYALVRLGITDSVKIAEFLHCSPQTVYNSRFKVRGKSHLAKEDFVNFVKQLGRFSH